MIEIWQAERGKIIGRNWTPDADWGKLRVKVRGNDVLAKNGRDGKASNGFRIVTWQLQARCVLPFRLEIDWLEWNHDYPIQIRRRLKWNKRSLRIARQSV